MDNQQLRAIIIKLQDRLSDDDRRRLHFFLGNDVPRRIRDDPTLSGTLCLMESLFDQDKINEEDCTFLINAFSEIRCIDAVGLLREHMRRIQSNKTNQPIQSLATIMSCTAEKDVRDDEEDRIGLSNVFIDGNNEFVRYKATVAHKNAYDNSFMAMNSENSRASEEPIVVSKPVAIPSTVEQKKSLITRRLPIILGFLIVFLVLTSIGLIVGILVMKSDMQKKEANCLEEQGRNNNTISDLTERLKRNNATFEASAKKSKDPEEITIGTTCGCEQWCATNGGLPYGVCGDGPTCICNREPITKQYVGSGCTCDAWCHQHGYKDGGICGDGYTCICST